MDHSWNDEEIVSYAIGDLPDPDRRRVEALARDDATLDATLAIMGAILGSGSTPEADAPAPRRPKLLRVAVAALVLMSVATYYSYSQAATAGRSNRDLASQNAKLRPMKAIVDAAEPTDGSLRTIAFQPGEDRDDVIPSGNATIVVRNATFACVLTWTIGEQSKQLVVPLEGLRAEIPSGHARIAIRPGHTRNWVQPFTTVHQGKLANHELGGAIGAILLNVKDGDAIEIRLEQPFTPWNATMTKFRGSWMIVTVECPEAGYRLPQFQRGEPSMLGESYPNTAFFWAKEGSEGIARELARHFVEKRATHPGSGRIRGMMHTGLIVPSAPDHVTPPFRDATADELVPVLTEAFETIRKQAPLVGPSVQDEIDKAARMLKDGSVKPWKLK